MVGRGGTNGEPLRQTPWGEIAWQLGGAEAFAGVAAHDEKMTAPGGDVIRAFLPQGPAYRVCCGSLLDVRVGRGKARDQGSPRRRRGDYRLGRVGPRRRARGAPGAGVLARGRMALMDRESLEGEIRAWPTVLRAALERRLRCAQQSARLKEQLEALEAAAAAEEGEEPAEPRARASHSRHHSWPRSQRRRGQPGFSTRWTFSRNPCPEIQVSLCGALWRSRKGGELEVAH
jgi:hypothetical protein